MKSSISLLLIGNVLLFFSAVEAFTPTRISTGPASCTFSMSASTLGRLTTWTTTTRTFLEASSSSPSTDLPTIEQLSKDPFMKQVEHGFALTSELLMASNDKQHELLLKDSLQAQLSHSDGIRGFMVSYLTSDESPADQDEIPVPLLQALKAQWHSEHQDAEDLVSLTCMNVIMPTAMITMHQEPELSQGSARTAQRGGKILKALLEEEDATMVRNNIRAILAVATDSATITNMNDSDSKLAEYWTTFFEKWGYQEAQCADIATAMKGLLGEEQQ